MIEQTNDAAIVAEVLQSFEGYNRALDEGDVDALNGYFWNAASTVRFGPTETLFGFDAIAAFRSGKWKGSGGGRASIGSPSPRSAMMSPPPTR